MIQYNENVIDIYYAEIYLLLFLTISTYKEGVEKLEEEFATTFDSLQQHAERVDVLEAEEDHWREYL